MDHRAKPADTISPMIEGAHVVDSPFVDSQRVEVKVKEQGSICGELGMIHMQDMIENIAENGAIGDRPSIYILRHGLEGPHLA